MSLIIPFPVRVDYSFFFIYIFNINILHAI